MLPEVRRYLLQYPDVDLPGADSFFYWEKVNFGLKPTIRVNHGVIYRTSSPGGDIFSVCVGDTAKPGRRGFYLITLKGSKQDGLTSIKSDIERAAPAAER